MADDGQNLNNTQEMQHFNAIYLAKIRINVAGETSLFFGTFYLRILLNCVLVWSSIAVFSTCKAALSSAERRFSLQPAQVRSPATWTLDSKA